MTSMIETLYLRQFRKHEGTPQAAQYALEAIESCIMNGAVPPEELLPYLAQAKQALIREIGARAKTHYTETEKAQKVFELRLAWQISKWDKRSRLRDGKLENMEDVRVRVAQQIGASEATLEGLYKGKKYQAAKDSADETFEIITFGHPLTEDIKPL